jgi:cobalamin biosynthesis Mg chelatase CobN
MTKCERCGAQVSSEDAALRDGLEYCLPCSGIVYSEKLEAQVADAVRQAEQERDREIAAADSQRQAALANVTADADASMREAREDYARNQKLEQARLEHQAQTATATRETPEASHPSRSAQAQDDAAPEVAPKTMSSADESLARLNRKSSNWPMLLLGLLLAIALALGLMFLAGGCSFGAGS